jgi:hypothetical protein
MKKLSAWLAMIVLLALGCGCSKKESTESHPANAGPPRESKAPEPELKGATPEDPGPIATVLSPLAILKGQATGLPTKPEVETPRELLPVDHPVYLKSEEPRNFLHKVFPVNKYTQFAFVVPPHQGHARLHGDFQSFTKRDAPDSTSDKTADVDLMLLNDQEFNEFRRGQMESATHELDPAHNQMVDWSVPPSYDEPQIYHLVFSNSDAATGAKFVKADFTVSFK